MTEGEIAYESDGYFVARTSKGFNVYKQGVTAAVRVAVCGYKGQKGLEWCKAEIRRRTRSTK